jgi:sugar (pentulose or hexulose) kinase
LTERWSLPVYPEEQTFSVSFGRSQKANSRHSPRSFDNLVGAPDWLQLLEEASSVPPGSRGLLLLPYFAGERTPGVLGQPAEQIDGRERLHPARQLGERGKEFGMPQWVIPKAARWIT